ncbi:MAG: PilN domain-containing protein [Deltaproteobacteria bacterium]|nr:PilN domain-containing protein [Deltaproteobacteria bacterium]
MSRQIDRFNTQITETKKEIEKYAKINKEIQTIKKKIAILKKKTEVIKTLEANRLKPVKLLDAMTQLVVPNRMWFTDFSDKGQDVAIKGVAVDNKTVADFMTRLENSDIFSSVNLKTLKQKKYQKITMKDFHITCNKAK